MKFIPCDEMSQIYSFARTNRKASYKDRIVQAKEREERKKERRRQPKKKKKR